MLVILNELLLYIARTKERTLFSARRCQSKKFHVNIRDYIEVIKHL